MDIQISGQSVICCWALPGEGPGIEGILALAPLQIRIDDGIEGHALAVLVASVGADQSAIFFLEQNFLAFRTSFHHVT